jgi:Uncharacterized protein conserved in bacteria
LNWWLRVGASEVLRNRRFHVHWKTLRPRKYLDLGCGPNTHSGFINLDFQWRRGVDICWDVSKGIPLDDNSLTGVFTEHCIEHIPLRDGYALLAECHRVLEPGGTLRIVTPDAEAYLIGYSRTLAGTNDGPLPRSERDEFQGFYTPAMTVNRVFNQFGHRFIYDFATFQAMLERQHFVNVTRSSFGEGRDPTLVIDTERRAPGSLYVEATKPFSPS